MMPIGSNDPHPSTVLGTREHAERVTQGRHPGVQSALQWLTFSHLPKDLQAFSAPFYTAAVDLLTEISTDSAELTTALNRLVDAKDSGVRAGIRDKHGRPGPVTRSATVLDPPPWPIPLGPESSRPISQAHIEPGNYGPGQLKPRPIQDRPQA